MKITHFTYLIVSFALLSCSGSVLAQTFVSSDPTGTTQTIVVPVGTGGVSDVDASFELLANGGSFTSELTFSLTSPTGTVVNLWGPGYGAGTSPSTGVYTFDDAAASLLPAVGAPGTWQPSNLNGTLLSDFNGEVADGIWTLVGSSTFSPPAIGSFTLMLNNVTPAVAPAPAPAVRRREVIPTILVTNVGAIQSTMTSGLGMGLVNQQITQNAPNAALSDLNNRLFRARSGMEQIFADGFESGDTSTWTGASTNNSSSLLRHLAFVQDQHMSYKVALGLADPEERTVEVGGAVDTLAQQTLSGGLPYAMMGVPMMPMAGGAATVHIVEAAPSGKTVIDDSKAVVEIAPLKRWELFAAGDFSNYDQDQLSNLMQGFTTTTYAGTAGLEYRVSEWLNLGAAWSYLQSDTNVAGNYGNIDLEGNLISGYATAFWRQYWADLLYSYGSFNNEISRNTGLGSRAQGDTDSQSHNIRLNFGRNFNVSRNIVTGPIAGLRYGTGDVDAYNERGGGSAALDYNGTDFESMISRIGWQATHTQATNWGRLVSQVHLAWEHEYMPENGTVGASLQTSPFALVTGNNVNRFGGFSAEDSGAHAGTDWLSAGAGLRFELASGVAFLTDYQGVFFRSNSSQHYASAKLSYEWGAFMPSGNIEDAGGKKIVAYEPLQMEESGRQIAVSPDAEEKQSPATFVDWLNRGSRNGGEVTSVEAKAKASDKKEVAAYEPLTVEQPERHVATTNTPAGHSQSQVKKKSVGGVIGWLQDRKRSKSDVGGAPSTVVAENTVDDVVVEPVTVSSAGRGHQKGAVVYKTWDEVPGLKKTEASVTPAKAVEQKDPSS